MMNDYHVPSGRIITGLESKILDLEKRVLSLEDEVRKNAVGMTRAETIAVLDEIKREWDYDVETGHRRADLAILNYINDPDITEAFEAVAKVYA